MKIFRTSLGAHPKYAEIDHTFLLDARRRAEDILVEGNKVYHFQVFSGVKHGFALRGDPNVENERKPANTQDISAGVGN